MQQEEQLWPGIVYRHAPGAFPLSTDAFCLAGFAAPPPKGNVADLGCACGVLGLLLAGRLPQLQVTGIELDPAAAAMAEENARRNGLSAQFRILAGDLKEIRSLLPAGGFSYVISNPPYYPAGSGAAAAGPERRNARGEYACTLADVCQAARWLLRYGGGFALVQKPERLAAVFQALHEAGIEPKRLRLVRHSPEKAPSLILVEGRRGGRPGLVWEPELILRDDAGHPTPEAERLYGRASLPAKPEPAASTQSKTL